MAINQIQKLMDFLKNNLSESRAKNQSFTFITSGGEIKLIGARATSLFVNAVIKRVYLSMPEIDLQRR